jgi:predicted molibdopterin-dependent oxidoreductase YjgC
LPDSEILAKIAKKAGFTFETTPEANFEEMKKVSKIYSAVNISDVKDYSKDSRYPNGELHLYSEKFSLPDGKAKFIPVEAKDESSDLILSTGRTATRYNTDEVINRIPGMQKYTPTLCINPVDAKKYGVSDGSMVLPKSRVGQLEIAARITEDVIPGVVFSYMHNADINYVVDAELDDETGTPKYKFTPVTIAPVIHTSS